VGRESAFTHINNLINKGAKIILIQSPGGGGKTTLAKKYLKNKFKIVLEFPIAKETKDIASIESLLRDKLPQLGEEPGRELMVSLQRLKQKLQTQEIGILIDNLEPALDASGKFIEQHRSYVELLRVLTDSDVKSLTLITSREKLHEASIEIETYGLPGLTLGAWQEYFKNQKIIINSESLQEIRDAFGGNAKAMDVISKVIIQDYKSDLEKYWSKNKEDLLIEPTLENLIKEQFKRLEEINLHNAYNLLCRMGCYRYQDFSTVPEQGLFCLLWDVAENKHQRIIRVLKERGLVEFNNDEYSLHPVIRKEAIDRLINSEDWKKANIKAAEFWTESVEQVNTITTDFYVKLTGISMEYNCVKLLFEAIQHLLNIKDFEKSYQILIFKILEAKELENLRCSTNLWNHTKRLIDVIQYLIEFLPNYHTMLLLIPLGVIYADDGKQNKAIKVAQNIIEITNTTLKNDYEMEFARMTAYLIIGKSQRLIGNLNKSQIACETASNIANTSGNYSWKALALYELANLYLEIGKPGRAICCFIASAFLAVGSKIPQELYQISGLLFEPIDKLSLKIREIFDKYNKSNKENDRSKKMAILWNLSKCCFAMKLYKLNKIIIDIGLSLLKENDKNFMCWFSIEMGNYYSAINSETEAEFYYKKAIEPSQGDTLSGRVQALKAYADWKYRSGKYDDSLTLYRELKTLLIGTEYISLQSHTFYQLGLTYQKMGEIEKSHTNFNEAIRLFNEIEAPKQVEKVERAKRGNID
jgi:tetratricopeptide (TPR) repeat protein